MLKLKYLFENYDLAKCALTNWAHDEEGLDELLSQYRISSNAIYPYSNKGEICFLRLSPTEEKLEKNILGELEFIEYLLGRGYGVLEAIKAKNGESCLTLSTEWGDYYATAFRRVRGTRLDNLDMNGEIAYKYGKALGDLHDLSAEYSDPRNKKWDYAEVMDWVRSVLVEYDAPECAFAEHKALMAELSALPKTRENFGLVHYDYELDNVFYDEESDTMNAIDFDDGMYHFYAIDVEQAIDAMRDELPEELYETAKTEFIRGYASVRGYDESMEALRPLMRRFVTLYGYARLTRSVAEHFDDEPEWLVSLREHLAGVIDEKLESFKR